MSNYSNTEIELPQPEDISEKDRENAFGTYMLMFASAYFPLPFIELALSIAYYYYFKKKSRYVTFHTYQSLLSQIPITIINTSFFIYAIYLFVSIMRERIITPEVKSMFFIILGVIVLINIVYNIVSLIIALKAKKGVIRYFPIIGRIAYDKFYGLHAMNINLNGIENNEKNLPPE